MNTIETLVENGCPEEVAVFLAVTMNGNFEDIPLVLTIKQCKGFLNSGWAIHSQASQMEAILSSKQDSLEKMISHWSKAQENEKARLLENCLKVCNPWEAKFALWCSLDDEEEDKLNLFLELSEMECDFECRINFYEETTTGSPERDELFQLLKLEADTFRKAKVLWNAAPEGSRDLREAWDLMKDLVQNQDDAFFLQSAADSSEQQLEAWKVLMANSWSLKECILLWQDGAEGSMHETEALRILKDKAKEVLDEKTE